MVAESQIDRDAVTVLRAIAEYANPDYANPEDDPQRGRWHLEQDDLIKATDLPWERINHALELLDLNDYVDVQQSLAGFRDAGLTPRGRYEYHRVTSITLQDANVQQGALAHPMPRPPQPVGSPYGFTDQDWEIVSERKENGASLYVVLGYQFSSTHYDSDKLKKNINGMFLRAVNDYNSDASSMNIRLEFKPLEAGYGEHLFNEIARDIIAADIAVFDTSDLNPNVMLEIGIALTWGVRVLPIKEQNCATPPSDISGQTWVDYTDSAESFIDPGHERKLLVMVTRAARKKGRST